MNGIERGVNRVSDAWPLEGTELAAPQGQKSARPPQSAGNHVVPFGKPEDTPDMPNAQKPGPDDGSVDEGIIMPAMETFSSGLTNTLAGSSKSLWSSYTTLVGGLGRIAGGDFARGFADIGKFVLGVFVQQPIDGFIMLSGSTFAGIHMLLGFEKPGRRLSEQETAEARKVFGDSIDYSKVRLKEGTQGVLSGIVRPFVFGDTVYVQGSKERFSKGALIHELAHVWQHQNRGTSYLSGAIGGQMFGDGYDWKKGFDSGLSFSELNPEQQAEFISYAYINGCFDLPEPPFVVGGRDYSAQLAQAKRLIRQR